MITAILILSIATLVISILVIISCYATWIKLSRDIEDTINIIFDSSFKTYLGAKFILKKEYGINLDKIYERTSDLMVQNEINNIENESEDEPDDDF